jgi:SPFH domain / Band 7 family
MLGQVFIIVFLIAAMIVSFRLRRLKAVYILDYQAGVRFRDGSSGTVLPPGNHRSSTGQDPITVIDLRPHQFILERLMFRDVLQANSVISVGGEIVACDPQLAVSTLKNLVNDSLTIIRESLRHTASQSMVDPSDEGRARLVEAVTAELNRELKSRGVEVRNLEVTELWAQPVKHAIPSEAN